MTNYKKIKNMSVKEMANYLFEHKLNFDPCIRSCVSCHYFISTVKEIALIG